MVRKLITTGLSLGLVAAFTVGGLAQQSNATQGDAPQRTERFGRKHGGKRGGHGIERLASQLNLTDAQRQQIQEIMRRNFEGERAQREELRQLHSQRRQGTPLSADAQTRAKTLSEQLKASRERTHQEVLNVLTAEQRTQLEQLKQNFGGRMKGGHGKGGHGFRAVGPRGLFRGLNLTEAQQQQIRAIHERFAAATKAQHDELRQLRQQARQSDGTTNETTRERAQALRTQIRQAAESMHQEVLGVLTPEQRTQFEQRRQERETRRQQFRQQREQRRNGQTDIQ